MSATTFEGRNYKTVLTLIAFFTAVFFVGYMTSELLPKFSWLVPAGILLVFFVIFISVNYNYKLLLFLILITLVAGSSIIPLISKVTYFLRFILLGMFALWEMLQILKRKYFIQKPAIIHGTMLIFVLITLMSTLYSLNPMLTFQRAFSWVLLYIAVFISIWNYCNKRSRIEEVFQMLVLTAMLALAAGILMIFISPGLLYISGRYRSIFNNPNLLGAFSTLFAPLVFWLYNYYPRGSKGKKISGLFLIFLLVNVFMSGSRASLLGTFIGLGFVFWMLGRMKLVAVSFVIVVCAITFMHIMGIGPQEVISDSFFANRVIRYSTLSTGSGRSLIWEQAIILFKQKPFLGWGWGVTTNMFQMGYVVEPIGFIGQYFHNSYLEFLVNTGLIGFLVFVSFIFYTLYKGWELLRKRPDRDTMLLAVVLMGSFIGGMINSIFESWMVSVGSALVLPYMVIGVLLIRLNLLHEEKKADGDDPDLEIREGDIVRETPVY